ncbi:MAG: AMP-binding protein [Gammaproteobacteria bacterium]|nr:AMP-binding protein [Gammaproteobacteria bacterium]
MVNIVGRRTLGGILAERAGSAGDRTCVVFEGGAGDAVTLTWAGLDERVSRCANLLAALGVRRGDKINLHLANCLEFLYLWFGAARLGAVIMPTNVASTADELEYLVTHSESRLVFTQPDFVAVAEEVRARSPGVEGLVVCGAKGDTAHQDFDALLAAAPAEAPPTSCEPGDEVAILYTSGTTSRPKGVVVTHANYIYAGETVAKGLGMGRDDRHLTVLPLFHGNAQYYSTMSTLVTGASMVLASRFSASAYFDQAIRHGCTVASLFAAPMRMLLAQPRREAHRDNRLRLVMFAQSITEQQLAEWQQRFGGSLMQIWGMTETMGPPLMNPLHGPRDNMSVGLPSMGYDVRLVDTNGRDVATGEVGQIVVRGEPGLTLMKEYFKNPEASAETLREGWLWSGDNARQDENGYFHFVDRVKDMIKRSGENVAASEVEAVILAHPDVFDCAVIGLPDPMRDEAIVAVVVPNEGAAPRAEDLLAWCRERLARFRVPQVIEFRDVLPRTSVGKIQKHVLRAELAGQIEIPPEPARRSRGR